MTKKMSQFENNKNGYHGNVSSAPLYTYEQALALSIEVYGKKTTIGACDDIEFVRYIESEVSKRAASRHVNAIVRKLLDDEHYRIKHHDEIARWYAVNYLPITCREYEIVVQASKRQRALRAKKRRGAA